MIVFERMGFQYSVYVKIVIMSYSCPTQWVEYQMHNQLTWAILVTAWGARRMYGSDHQESSLWVMEGRDCQDFALILGVIAPSLRSYHDRMFHLYLPRPVVAGSWSRGYDVALTWRRSQVQFLPSPPIVLNQLLGLFKDIWKTNSALAFVLLT